MNYVKIHYVDFVPGGNCANGNSDFIYVFSHRINGKIYKRKMMETGGIAYNKKIKEWTFIPVPGGNVSYGCTIMRIISTFLDRLNKKINVYDKEKGEIQGELHRYE